MRCTAALGRADVPAAGQQLLVTELSSAPAMLATLGSWLQFRWGDDLLHAVCDHVQQL